MTMTEKEYRKKFARSGGLARAKVLSKKRRVQIARKAANARYRNAAKKRRGDDRSGNSHQRRKQKRAEVQNGGAK